MVRSQQDKGSQEWKERYLETYRNIPVVRSAAQMAGVDRRTVNRAIKNDPDFAKKCQVAKEDGIEVLEQTAHTMAQSDSRMVMYLLKYLKPEVYGDKQQIEHNIKIDRIELDAFNNNDD